ncbi:MAG: 4-hydroxy-tetrahydrodipicolinate reductase [Alphaproteobacteria bacterium]|nr:4-hydroxy-tetrahydrodipicolinate reductase [Alphaproteobacteria bacterium]
MKIGILGGGGRMGLALVRQIAATPGAALAGGCERAGHPALGQDLGVAAGLTPAGKLLTADAAALAGAADVLLDFTLPRIVAEHVEMAARIGTPIVVGTTGTEAAEDARIRAAAATVAVLRAANMSVGVNLLLALTRQVAATLDADFDIEIVEMHHRHKVDAPSGTALALGRAAAAGRGIEHDKAAVRGRDGITGERRRGSIGYAALRGGNVAGEHSVIFAADNERVELTHRATDRGIFARGAVTAALWLAGKPAGFYSMADVLGFSA